ncbi:hypothetical protein, partial [Nonomuraea sp. NPDC049784]|uniref:hypothetical protein n=1 Tax=Nonomuraea sp. NPDC049784 TaxID=3154361 RepID=UPI0033EA6093
MISDDDYLYYVDRALDGMTGIVAGLGDRLANTRPPLPGANSPYALLTHCLGVVSYWAGQLVAGRE